MRDQKHTDMTIRTICTIVAKDLGVVVAALLVLFACGCSSFNRDWKKAAQMPVTLASMEGRWQGRWLSDVNGHNGKLLCIMSRQENGDYAARFRATYWKVFKFSYTVPLKAERTNDVWHFRGEENLGVLAGGVYEYAGNATPTNFHSTYGSKYDHGIFEMTRPANGD